MRRRPAFPADVLEALNRMERGGDALEVGAAALRHHALTRPIPDPHLWRRADVYADVVLAALWRRGWLE